MENKQWYLKCESGNQYLVDLFEPLDSGYKAYRLVAPLSLDDQKKAAVQDGRNYHFDGDRYWLVG